ncbi:lymphocyte-specific helicase-like isoform X2 [Ruditapes philippinarum]|uniref:lymphocyte-specific helicase-like isoform X2 n=1 Tax=Ruditapes philippinarum TaxID=129788 RepID=UPI00295B56E5|nr:lymphocyte-specific helicase-like isoform X2 [Ruditapes philippinarum]
MSTVCEVGLESPFKPAINEADTPREEACSKYGSEQDNLESVDAGDVESVGMESAESVSSYPNDEMITESEIKEETKHEKEGEAEEEAEIQKRKELWLHMDQNTKEERYKRLQYLLMKSNMYTEYLLRRMEKQREEEKKRKERLINKQAKEEEKKKEEKDKQGTEPSQTTDSRKTRGSLKLRAPIPKRMSKTNTPTTSPATAGVDSNKTPEVEAAKVDDEGTCSQTEANTEQSSPTADKENTFTRKKTRNSLKPPEEEDTESKKGRKRKNMDYNEQSPQGAKLLTNIFQFKKRKVEDEDKSTEIKIERKIKKEGELFQGKADVADDGTILRPALFSGGSLRKYQIEGLNWLKVLYENGINGMLADEMGLGKTIQCIALITQIVTMGATGPFLVVAPLSTLPNWRMEFKRFAPYLPLVFHHGSKDFRNLSLKDIRKKHKIMEGVTIHPVVITSYEVAMLDRPALTKFDWTYMIIDEGHRMKNRHCRLARELKVFTTAHRLLLTGTPLQNNLAELWSMLNFLLPEIFDDLGSFEAWFDVTVMSDEDADSAIIEEEKKSNILGMLHQILTPFMLRRLKTDVDLEIPPKKELIVYCPLTALQKDLYETTVNRSIFEKAKSRTEKEDEEFQKEIEMNDFKRPKRGRKTFTRKQGPVEVKTAEVSYTLRNIMMQLRKICNHPYLVEHPLGEFDMPKVDEDLLKSCGKMMVLDKMLTELRRRGHKVLVFSQMTRMLDLIEDYLYMREINFCRLDGSRKIEDRQSSMEKFNKDPDTWVFLLSTRAGGLGINLVAADTVIIYDSDWNPQQDLQAQDRCHRIGQTKPVVVYRFVTADTIDQKIVERAAAKRKLEKMVIAKGKFKAGITKEFTPEVKPFTPEELLELLKSKDHCGEVDKGKHGEVISQKDLDELLDRSDLVAQFEKSKEKKQETPEDKTN